MARIEQLRRFAQSRPWEKRPPELLLIAPPAAGASLPPRSGGVMPGAGGGPIGAVNLQASRISMPKQFASPAQPPAGPPEGTY